MKSELQLLAEEYGLNSADDFFATKKSCMLKPKYWHLADKFVNNLKSQFNYVKSLPDNDL